MATSYKRKSECGPYICCGAAAVSLSHEPGEPTGIDNMVSAVKRLFSRKDNVSMETVPAEQGAASYAL
ncbi:hypothetical protein [Slackia heliotrinireducens]|jgi:hypothetical protein|uniref:Uncharacterized protein n=1 Tax=Slackia heliotrinireducens (strain ATCC 29202 / DSM 20476 / NCTC 11029 / RHS 1) TaxID=471855 RepID=C7N1Y1_SLAHD|nr:hypothetical protein [Slackia heliotrinireducens]ACV23422.1 hypothetical protein Shel_24140 [Slackia heliotrinireducens DSM 20476]VEH02723.1 Uncharacterised protein [Slackia heliotrinireducens]